MFQTPKFLCKDHLRRTQMISGPHIVGLLTPFGWVFVVEVGLICHFVLIHFQFDISDCFVFLSKTRSQKVLIVVN